METKNGTYIILKVYVSHNNIISNLGFTSDAVVANIAKGNSGLQRIEDDSLLPHAFVASKIPADIISKEFSQIGDPKKFTKLEQLMILSLGKTIENASISIDEKVGLIISTTKGNIDLLEKKDTFPTERVYLSEFGNTIKEFFKFKNEALVLSNACVSGIMAISVAKKLIQVKKFDHVFIVSGDILSEFILSGFNSFQALSEEHCRPYDKARKGINLGEVAASALITSDLKNLADEAVEIIGDSTCNDANHISGPSRTGEGLYRSVTLAIKEAGIETAAIDYISAHGTATSFNDAMEAVAFNRAGLNEVPLNSLKGYFGHTLGASGLLETIVGMHSLKKNTLYKSLGFEELGVSEALNIITENRSKQLHIFLKTASGFGGCNTAVLFKKIN